MDNYVKNYEDLSGEMVSTSVFASLMRKVYLWMAFALATSGLAAYYVATSPQMLAAIYGNSYMMWVLIILEFGLVIGLTAAIRKLSFPVAALMFVVYSLVNGIVLSSVFLTYTMSSIATTFFATAGTFGAMAVVGSVTKKDLTRIGSLAFMGLIGVVIASLINLFVGNGIFDIIISIIGIITFLGLTAYDAQKIKQMMLAADDVNNETQKLAVVGALSLYLDFINLFLYLLRFFGRGRN
ncbi:MAG: Bax inhibitor-1/YccA family protein [Bacteroidaceae bacterium]|nr:Bax inhibitor-1/YccA family protein [Bacteroidaceae bacterium]